MPKCICGRRFASSGPLRNHENACKDVKNRSLRIQQLIARPKNDPKRPKKRTHAEEQEELKLEAESDLLMGKTKSRRLQSSENGEGSSNMAQQAALSMGQDNISSLVTNAYSADELIALDEAPEVDGGLGTSNFVTVMENETNAESTVDVPLPSKRLRWPTERAKAMLEDNLPEGPGILHSESDDDLSTPDRSTASLGVADPRPLSPAPLRIRIRRIWKTTANKFGLVRSYHGRPSNVPKSQFSQFIAEELRPIEGEDRLHQHPTTASSEQKTLETIISPYPNISAFLYNRWHWNGAKKTKKGRGDFLKDVLGHKDFRTEDIKGVDFDRLDKELAKNPGGVVEDNGWLTSSVPIYIPTGKKETKASKREVAASRRRQAQILINSDDEDDEKSETDYPSGRKYVVPDFHHRRLVDIIKETFSGPEAANFHYHPFEEHWTPPWNDGIRERVFGDISSSKAFLDADRELQNLPPEPNCELPRAIASMMLYSDATHVAQFGQAKLWPIYLYFGNQSKYERGRHSRTSGQNVAFLPSLPASITDFILNDPSSKVSAPLLAHCKRELFHGCWKIILDDDFLHAYEHGIVVDCGDGIRRRLYPRIFFYSADYPEKVLVATIRDNGQCPCPRCKVKKEDICDIGKHSDIATRQTATRKDDEDRREKVRAARSLIYNKGYVVTSTHVEDLLKEESLVPTENVFSARLHNFGFDFFQMLVCDFMHEWEIGSWKAFLLHLIRILHSLGSNIVHEFNHRFRQVAPFGRSTIRKFPYNVADLSKLGARDYEDILLCCIPCFEGLLPSPHNETVLDMLYIMNYWHSLAKLRMHTDTSLRVFRQVTTVLGECFRYFANETCRHFDTFETDKEYQARSRASARRVAKAAINAHPGTSIASPTSPIDSSFPVPPSELDISAVLVDNNPAPSSANGHSASTTSSGKRRKVFSLTTPKLHFLPDYPDEIERFGTTDCTSTLVGESRHTHLKSLNSRTNFNRATVQIIGMDVREAVHARMTHELEKLERPELQNKNRIIPTSELSKNYHIARDERNKIYLPDMLKERQQDPAYRDFLPHLRRHLLARKKGLAIPGDEPAGNDDELSQLIIQDKFIYSHATTSFNYTTYDIRRDQDTINLTSGRCDIMLPSFEDERDSSHPYWYARVLGIYHAKVFYPGQPTSERVDFLWVRWLGQDIEWKGGPSSLRLDRIGFVPIQDMDPFGFLDPSLVIRACHLIPAFHLGRSFRLLGPSMVRDPKGDWENYYVNRFVDRDMMMRYLGTGVGHCQSRNFPREYDQLRTVPEGNFYVSSSGNFDVLQGGANTVQEDMPDDGDEDYNDIEMSGSEEEDI